MALRPPVVRVPRAAVLPVILALCLASGQPSAQKLPVTDLLDRYVDGQFEAVASVLASKIDFADLLRQLKADGLAWIEAKGSAARERRELAAATFALEAAQADEWNEWSLRQRQPPMEAPGGPPYQPPDLFYWNPPPLLIEWGCQLFRRDSTPRPAERLWQLAALAVAERAEDPEFLMGTAGGPIGNPGVEVYHLRHVLERFPNEARVTLAYAVSLEWRTWSQAERKPSPSNVPRLRAAKEAFEALQPEEEITAEVGLRLGVIHLRARDLDEALTRFERVESSTRDPYLIYLARYFSAQAFEAKGREADAMRAYGRALATVPHAQSAALPFAAFLFKADRRAEAYDIIDGALTPNPPAADPWRAYADADGRFWPLLLARLHAVIHP